MMSAPPIMAPSVVPSVRTPSAAALSHTEMATGKNSTTAVATPALDHDVRVLHLVGFVQQLTVVLRIVSGSLMFVAGERIDRLNRRPPRERDDFGRAVAEIPQQHLETQVALGGAVVGDAGAPHVVGVGGSVLGADAGRLSRPRSPPSTARRSS